MLFMQCQIKTNQYMASIPIKVIVDMTTAVPIVGFIIPNLFLYKEKRSGLSYCLKYVAIMVVVLLPEIPDSDQLTNHHQ
jgi:hypothetical protein